MRRAASLSTSSTSQHHATIYPLRYSALSPDRRPKLNSVGEVAHHEPTPNHSSGQTASDDRRRLHPAAVFYIVSAAGYLALLYFQLQLERSLKHLQHRVGTTVNFDHFIEKFLAAGEVRRIMYLPRQRLAVAWLQPGALVDGKTFPHPHVFVHFDVPHATAAEFRRRIGEAEDELGIALAHRVPITEYAAINNVELTIGVINAVVVASLLVRRYGLPGLRALHSGRSLSK